MARFPLGFGTFVGGEDGGFFDDRLSFTKLRRIYTSRAHRKTRVIGTRGPRRWI